MDDLISRQSAIDALDKRFDSIPMDQTTEILLLRKDLKDLPPAQPEPCEDAVSRAWLLAEYDRQHQGPPGGARKIIETAPPVTPKQRTGKWVMNDHIGTFKIFTCSECGWNSEAPFNFCPNCGAKMTEGDAE